MSFLQCDQIDRDQKLDNHEIDNSLRYSCAATIKNINDYIWVNCPQTTSTGERLTSSVASCDLGRLA